MYKYKRIPSVYYNIIKDGICYISIKIIISAHCSVKYNFCLFASINNKLHYFPIHLDNYLHHNNLLTFNWSNYYYYYYLNLLTYFLETIFNAQKSVLKIKQTNKSIAQLSVVAPLSI